MNLIGLIQARDASDRLPRKATMDLNGKVLIHHLYDRLMAVGSLDKVVVSTSVQSPEIIGWCKVNDVPYYAGPEDDLLTRHLGAAEMCKADAILRTTGDQPFHDPAMLDKMIGGFRQARGADALINWHDGQRTISEGLDAEIVNVRVMRELNKDKNCPREDWLTFLDRSPRYRVMGWAYPDRVGHKIHLSVDTPEDLEQAKLMLSWLGEARGYIDTLKAYERVRNVKVGP